MDPDKNKLDYKMLLGPRVFDGPSGCDLWMEQVADRKQPPSVRIRALENLRRDCRDHRAFQVLRFLVEEDRDDAVVRSAVVRAFPSWDDAFFPAMAVVRALSIGAVRQAAIETLDRMGSLPAEKDKRLAGELASLQSGSAKLLRVSTMPGLYGKAPRLLDYLKQMVHAGNRWERALAASELYGLGELSPALEAVHDSDSRVRKSLAAAIARFGNERRITILPGTGDGSWRQFLEELSEFRLADPLVTAKLSRERVQSGWLGERGATDAQLQALEYKIRRPLPLSYRTFLATSNGFLHQSSFIWKLFGSDDVDWFRVRNTEWAAAYRDTYPKLGSCLQVSDTGDAAVVLLNPEVIDADGEWQTFFFANWVPGARVYKNFREFMESELDSVCEWKNR